MVDEYNYDSTVVCKMSTSMRTNGVTDWEEENGNHVGLYSIGKDGLLYIVKGI